MRIVGRVSLAFAAMIGSAAFAAAGSAVDDATRWASRIDRGEYAESWSDAGVLFKAQTSQSQWASAVEPFRRPLGEVASRRLKSETKTHTLPGAPDGDYAVVKFDTDFANKHAAVETVVLAHEPSGWKVDGYFIR